MEGSSKWGVAMAFRFLCNPCKVCGSAIIIWHPLGDTGFFGAIFCSIWGTVLHASWRDYVSFVLMAITRGVAFFDLSSYLG